jgi:hypothetical protein
MAGSLMDRLVAARRQRFVGRAVERELFCSALRAEELPFVVFYLFGPGGVGKSTLLREFAALAGQHGASAVYLDSRNIDPAPETFLSALQQGLQVDDPQLIIPTLAARRERTVLLFDTAELLTPIDGWLRENFLPQLPDHILVVMAGRNPPSLEWRTDPGWTVMMRIAPLRNLSVGEGRDYLIRCQIPDSEHEAVLDFTRGHPLALALAVDALAQRPGSHFEPEQARDVIKTLLEQFVEKAPSPAHRAALEACALVRLTTESLLAALLDTPDAHELFDWLRSLSFVEPDRFGLFPHDLARESLVADLRWRNPEWYAELHSRARRFYMNRVQLGDAEEQGRVLAHYVYLHRDNPVVRPYFEWQASSALFSDSFRPPDQAELMAMVRRYEGEQAARLADHWIQHQPKGVSVVRYAGGEIQGVLIAVSLERVTLEERQQDPALVAVWDYLQHHAPVRPGETATLFRFWLARDHYQDVSPVQSRIFFTMVQHYLTTPKLAYTFLPCANPAFWQAVFTYADLARIESADFELEGRRFGVYGHDWRITPPMAWLAVLAERELDAETRPTAIDGPEPPTVLSHEQFVEAVRDALRDFTNQNSLRTNPLIQSQLVFRRSQHDRSAANRIQILQTLLSESAALLQKSPKQARLYRALQVTYFDPAPTQELAAERLDLPFSTYRRHLRAGLDAVAEWLWQQEMG